MTRVALGAGVVVAALLLAAGLARTGSAPAAPARAGDLERVLAAPPPGTPRYIAGYRTWLKVNRKPIPNTPTTAHPATVKDVFVNRRPFPRTARIRLPYGAVLVKEGRADDGSVRLLAVMRKVRGADPKHNDWVWVEYSRSSGSGRFGVLARGAVCWGCHQQAAAHDYIFTRR